MEERENEQLQMVDFFHVRGEEILNHVCLPISLAINPQTPHKMVVILLVSTMLTAIVIEAFQMLPDI